MSSARGNLTKGNLNQSFEINTKLHNHRASLGQNLDQRTGFGQTVG